MVDTAVDYGAKREGLTRKYLKPKAERPESTAVGVHHLEQQFGDPPCGDDDKDGGGISGGRRADRPGPWLQGGYHRASP